MSPLAEPPVSFASKTEGKSVANMAASAPDVAGSRGVSAAL